MTYNPNLDRTDWRARADKELIEAARDSGHELAIALGERLEETDDLAIELEALRDELDELRRERDRLRDELNEIESQGETDQ